MLWVESRVVPAAVDRLKGDIGADFFLRGVGIDIGRVGGVIPVRIGRGVPAPGLIVRIRFAAHAGNILLLQVQGLILVLIPGQLDLPIVGGSVVPFAVDHLEGDRHHGQRLFSVGIGKGGIPGDSGGRGGRGVPASRLVGEISGAAAHGGDLRRQQVEGIALEALQGHFFIRAVSGVVPIAVDHLEGDLIAECPPGPVFLVALIRGGNGGHRVSGEVLVVEPAAERKAVPGHVLFPGKGCGRAVGIACHVLAVGDRAAVGMQRDSVALAPERGGYGHVFGGHLEGILAAGGCDGCGARGPGIGQRIQLHAFRHVGDGDLDGCSRLGQGRGGAHRGAIAVRHGHGIRRGQGQLLPCNGRYFIAGQRAGVDIALCVLQIDFPAAVLPVLHVDRAGIAAGLHEIIAAGKADV